MSWECQTFFSCLPRAPSRNFKKKVLAPPWRSRYLPRQSFPPHSHPPSPLCAYFHKRRIPFPSFPKKSRSRVPKTFVPRMFCSSFQPPLLIQEVQSTLLRVTASGVFVPRCRWQWRRDYRRPSPFLLRSLADGAPSPSAVCLTSALPTHSQSFLLLRLSQFTCSYHLRLCQFHIPICLLSANNTHRVPQAPTGPLRAMDRTFLTCCCPRAVFVSSLASCSTLSLLCGSFFVRASPVRSLHCCLDSRSRFAPPALSCRRPTCFFPSAATPFSATAIHIPVPSRKNGWLQLRASLPANSFAAHSTCVVQRLKC
ncbi:hypothetical protein TRVL_06093 [Trypanosoma vivax]|nr:hypothetical protein TRVL_06093 [Trypanosoma vivax]